MLQFYLLSRREGRTTFSGFPEMPKPPRKNKLNLSYDLEFETFSILLVIFMPYFDFILLIIRKVDCLMMPFF